MLLPSFCISFILSKHFFWKGPSPTARISSTSKSSGSVWIVNNLQLTGSLQSPISITARSKIFKTTKDTLLSDVPTVKPGSIILHSLHPVGDVKYPNGIPEGYLLCDGTEYYQSHYPDLFEALGAASAAGVTIDKFVVPNIEAPQSFGNMIVLAYIIYTGKI